LIHVNVRAPAGECYPDASVLAVTAADWTICSTRSQNENVDGRDVGAKQSFVAHRAMTVTDMLDDQTKSPSYRRSKNVDGRDKPGHDLE